MGLMGASYGSLWGLTGDATRSADHPSGSGNFRFLKFAVRVVSDSPTSLVSPQPIFAAGAWSEDARSLPCPPPQYPKSRPLSQKKWFTSTPQLPFKRPQISSNRYHKALPRGTLVGLGTDHCFGYCGGPRRLCHLFRNSSLFLL